MSMDSGQAARALLSVSAADLDAKWPQAGGPRLPDPVLLPVARMMGMARPTGAVPVRC